MINLHTSNLVARLQNRYSIDRIDMTMSNWIEENTRLKKKPFSFADYYFQKEIVDDMHPNLDVMKCSQVGLTEVQLRKALAFVNRYNGVKAIFTLPNEKMFKRVSKTRLQPIVQQSPVFNPEGSGDWTRSMDLMQFDQSFLYITGATEGDATSIDADAVFNDEVDLTNQQMLALFNSRMQNSSHRLSQRFSTPTHVGFGIDKGYSESDQREYMCRCSACNHWNIPEVTRSFLHLPGLPDDMEEIWHLDAKHMPLLDLDAAYVMCERCHAPLDLDNPEMRSWVARYAERSKFAHGYFVRPFVTSRLDIEYVLSQLLKYKQRDFIRGWHNTVLGQAYTDGNSRLSEVDIKANFQGPSDIPFNSTDPLVIGIDAGLTCHVTIGKLTSQGPVIAKFLTVGADDLVGWVEDFCEGHNVVTGSMDRFPYTPTANAVFEVSKGKIFPVEYRGAKEINPIKNEHGDVVYFQANRTLLIDAVAAQVRKHKLPMGGYGAFEHIVVEHLRDMVREEEPEAEATWKKLNGNDHYFHALGFMLFSLRITDVIDLLNDADPRTMIGVLGVDTKSSSSSLYRTGRHTPHNLNGGMSMLGYRG